MPAPRAEAGTTPKMTPAPSRCSRSERISHCNGPTRSRASEMLVRVRTVPSPIAFDSFSCLSLYFLGANNPSCAENSVEVAWNQSSHPCLVLPRMHQRVCMFNHASARSPGLFSWISSDPLIKYILTLLPGCPQHEKKSLTKIRQDYRYARKARGVYRPVFRSHSAFPCTLEKASR